MQVHILWRETPYAHHVLWVTTALTPHWTISMNALRVHSHWGLQLNVNLVPLAGSVQTLMEVPMLFAPR